MILSSSNFTHCFTALKFICFFFTLIHLTNWQPKCGFTQEFLFMKRRDVGLPLFSFKISLLILCVKEVTAKGYWVTVLFWCEGVVSYVFTHNVTFIWFCYTCHKYNYKIPKVLHKGQSQRYFFVYLFNQCAIVLRANYRCVMTIKTLDKKC